MGIEEIKHGTTSICMSGNTKLVQSGNIPENNEKTKTTVKNKLGFK